jgi:predicted HicB family RNase H-like nuclease
VPRRRARLRGSPDAYHFSSRIPKHVHKELKILSVSLDIPLQQMIIEALEEYVARMKRKEDGYIDSTF